MRAIAIGLVCAFASLAFVLPLIAQEGHPLTGSWTGNWGSSAQQRNHVLIEMKWTGKEIVGTVNPGPNASPMKVARLNPADWSVHIEADVKDANGRAVPTVIDGKIENLGSYNRTIVGTWTQGTTRGDFTLTRQ
jgi:hypothetical protein